MSNRRAAKALSSLEKVASEETRKGPISVERMAVMLFKQSWENKSKVGGVGEHRVLNNTANDWSGIFF